MTVCVYPLSPLPALSLSHRPGEDLIIHSCRSQGIWQPAVLLLAHVHLSEAYLHFACKLRLQLGFAFFFSEWGVPIAGLASALGTHFIFALCHGSQLFPHKSS